MTSAAQQNRGVTAKTAKHTGEFSAWLDNAVSQAHEVLDRLQAEMKQHIEAARLTGGGATKAK